MDELAARTFFYDRKGNPITLGQWADRTGSQDPLVARTRIGEAELSTVYVGLDMGLGLGPPLIFESMIFGGDHDGFQRRYASEADALAGHKQILGRLALGEAP